MSETAKKIADEVLSNGHINETWHLRNMSRIMAKLNFDNNVAPVNAGPEITQVSTAEHLNMANDAEAILRYELSTIIDRYLAERDKRIAERLIDKYGFCPFEIGEFIVRIGGQYRNEAKINLTAAIAEMGGK